MTDRIDLEKQITLCSMVINDIEDLTEEVIEGEPTRDQISNVLIGLEALYTIRFNKLQRILEQLIEEGAFRKEEKPTDPFGNPLPSGKTPFQKFMDSLPPVDEIPKVKKTTKKQKAKK